jgi:hypothetical protein
MTGEFHHVPIEERAMPNPTNSEATAIEEAYQNQVKALFNVLFTNLIGEPVSHETDQQCSEGFAAGVKIAKRARDLALNAV